MERKRGRKQKKAHGPKRTRARLTAEKVPPMDDRDTFTRWGRDRGWVHTSARDTGKAVGTTAQPARISVPRPWFSSPLFFFSCVAFCFFTGRASGRQ